MALVRPDGYVLDSLGPFYGTDNGATISSHIIRTRNALTDWCDAGDIMVVDRGFRDVVEALAEMDYEPEMPVYLCKGQKQHTTIVGNESRLVPKVRWIVESYPARFKKWQFFVEHVENSLLPKLADRVHIVPASFNKHRDSIVNDAKTDRYGNIAQLMRDRLAKKNLLAQSAEAGSLSARSHWKKINNVDFDFPELDIDELRQLFFDCCTHVASIVWYLAYVRHNDFEPSTGRRHIQQAIEKIDAPSSEEEHDTS
ncbi:unnamed protein product [Didymodactylos carnosus]|uniref:DDE Tnp4 domain-containing protein n=1 Tax=Didymodactylos carnosus TaxID=1234261 RepID=A0A814RN85_9BILA|nr:unnamed protein product [Didymodactylos carnosus]CAF1434966.1 unnamed protein product [Didymodactylos carnosus]CAF3898164.1 unnamed protein product [Didymodactylos carnosus]CAF4232421.1 unnamed protein product [Didymodactylos carnosus]